MGVLCNTSNDTSDKAISVLEADFADELTDCESDGIVEHPIITGGLSDPVLLKRNFCGERPTASHSDTCIEKCLDHLPQKNENDPKKYGTPEVGKRSITVKCPYIDILRERSQRTIRL